jgi:hypothetical protein
VTTITGIRLKSDNLFWNYTELQKNQSKEGMSHRYPIDVPYMTHRCPNYKMIGTSMEKLWQVYGSSLGYDGI